MLINKSSLEFASKFVGKDDTRHALRGVRIERDRLVATDGHMLAIVNHGAEHKPSDYPAVPGYSYPDAVDYYANGPEPLNPTLVHADSIKVACKAIPAMKGRIKHFPVLDNLLIDTERTNLNGTVHAYATDLENPQALTLKKMDEQFPQYEQVLLKDEPCYSVAVNPAYLKQIGEAYDKLGARSVTMEFWPNRLQPIRFTGTADYNRYKATVLLMPIKADNAKGLHTTVKRWAETVCRDDLSGYDIR
jgi:hypothetical protein